MHTRKLVLIGVLVLAGGVYACDNEGDPVGIDPDPDPEPSGDVGLQLVAQGLTAPVMLAEPPGGNGRLFIVDQVGLIRVVTPEGQLVQEPFLDIRNRMVTLMSGFDERGLLGLAFHPDYATNRRFFVYYSAPLRAGAPANWNHTSHISEFRASDTDPNRADPGSERVLLRVDEPQFNHNAGTLAFGPRDRMLYISLGDGGGRDDEGAGPAQNTPVVGHVADWYARNAGGNGQDIEENLLGSILRIDVNTGSPYGIPADNPFVDRPGLDEIWAYGFRNPYRFSFDRGGDNRLLVGDAGQDLYEEVSVVTRGGNYGWNVREGTHCFDAENPRTPPQSCPTTVESGIRQGDPLVGPVIEFRNSGAGAGGLGVTVVGGYVYRGERLRSLVGQYLFGTWSTAFSLPDGRVYAATPGTGAALWQFEELRFSNTPTGNLNHFVMGFGEDARGELYVLTSDNVGPSGSSGKVYRLVEPGERQ